ncbi:MAG: HNH endonuclease [Oscillospiraceae bacterium]|jgi:5-methylcytosine-specific restriction endonuclease McrA|nr:HNH endonuclease [Oscillospiraceae bacterium]
MQPWAEKFYKSLTWQKCRESFLSSRNFFCERCAKKKTLRTAVIAHHKRPLTPKNINDPFITLSPDNLQALCKDCHRRAHTRGRKAKSRYSFDERGEIYER